MLIESAILPIILAGVMNGSFVIPSRYVSHAFQKKLWFYYSIVGLIFIPWIISIFLLPGSLKNYLLINQYVFAFIAFGGFLFGIGQLFFVNAIERIGLALSFAINLGLGVTIGSMFVIFYKSFSFSSTDFLTTIAVFLIILSLIIYYHSGKPAHQLKLNHHKNYLRGWLFAIIAGLASGFQNITFFIVAFHVSTGFSNSFWVWPPFLLFAALPMVVGFYYRFKKDVSITLSSNSVKLQLQHIFLSSLMGLFFTGSLALYSYGMNQLSQTQQVIGWPAFMVSIILVSQMWGKIYDEGSLANKKSKFYQLISIILLIMAIILLSVSN